MAYDEASRSIVLFGGKNDSQPPDRTYLNDTWTWDGLRWTQHNPPTSPKSTMGAAMAYDVVSQSVVLFTTGGQTWLWSGRTKTWAQQSPRISPPSRLYAAMAYDPASSTVLLFGGYGSPDWGDTWTWNGATKTWTQHFPSPKPPGRFGASMATDPAANNVVLFGGKLGDGSDGGDTWTWDGIGKKWTVHAPAISPHPRRDASMAQDDGGNVLLFGGIGSLGTVDAETWVWNGLTKKWSSNGVPGPMVRQGASMAYDAARRRTVLFGGWGVSPFLGWGVYPGEAERPWLDDTWTYGTVV